MNLRSLMLAALMLVVGIGIGVSLQGDPPLQPALARTATADRPPAASTPPSDIATNAGTNSGSRPEVAVVRERPQRADSPVPATPPLDSAGREDRRFAESSFKAREERIYRDDTFGPDEPGTPFPPEVDGDGAYEDFELYRDGPVSRSESGDSEGGADPPSEPEPTERDRALEAEGCFAPFSPCRIDTDCCGSSVCRSAPGTISGSFECTPT